MTHPLHGVHGRQHRFPDRVGTVAHITEGTREAPAFLYLLLDKPAPDGRMVLIIGADDFIPTDPAALRARFALSPARDLGTAENARLREERDEALRQLGEERAKVAHLTPLASLTLIRHGSFEPVANTGDCRTCKWAVVPHRCAEPYAGPGDATLAWQDVHLSPDSMTRLPTSPPCPGYIRKES